MCRYQFDPPISSTIKFLNWFKFLKLTSFFSTAPITLPIGTISLRLKSSTPDSVDPSITWNSCRRPESFDLICLSNCCLPDCWTRPRYEFKEFGRFSTDGFICVDWSQIYCRLFTSHWIPRTPSFPSSTFTSWWNCVTSPAKWNSSSITLSITKVLSIA